jgi:hypothetical protein
MICCLEIGDDSVLEGCRAIDFVDNYRDRPKH